METEKLNFYFGTKGCPSKYDFMNFNELLKGFFRADYFEEDQHDYLQAFQNKFSKMLSVPTIRLFIKPIFHTGIFCARNTKKRIQNVEIKMDPYSDLAEMIFVVPHEVKHSQQAYDFHKFINFNIVPKDDLGKAILLSNILEETSKNYVENLEYNSQIDELDANVFAINQMHNLMNKYPLYGNFDFQLHLREQMFVLLYGLRYNYDGIHNKEIEKSINNLESGIKSALNGKFGNSCKSAVERIIRTGFNIENAYRSITSELDKYSAWIVLENHKFNKLGAERINLAINGELNYAPKDTYISFENVIDDETIDPFSEYGEYIKKYACTDNGEFGELLQSFLEEKRNCYSI